VGALATYSVTCYTVVMTEPAQTNVVEFLTREEWEERLERLGTQDTERQIVLPRQVKGRKVSRQEVAEAFIAAFECIGGVPRLALWANEHPTEFYKIMSRLLPRETHGTTDASVTVRHVLPPSDLDK
jgi:hypothetical protein